MKSLPLWGRGTAERWKRFQSSYQHLSLAKKYSIGVLLPKGIEKKGIEKGLDKGRKQGQEAEKLASARRMIAKGKFTAEDISESVDLPLERIQEHMKAQTA